uniref:Uncharacterized protein n=1 Tax=Rhizophora mucronata TaxID=61149 RepID=A0A2P2NVN6_RHIMU
MQLESKPALPPQYQESQPLRTHEQVH